jgi:hypothetical protein
MWPAVDNSKEICASRKNDRDEPLLEGGFPWRAFDCTLGKCFLFLFAVADGFGPS